MGLSNVSERPKWKWVYSLQIYRPVSGIGLRVVVSRPQTEGRPRVLECFLGEGICIEARGHGGRPLGPWGHLVEAPLFKTSPDTHPVAWVQSEGSQQRGGWGWRMGGVEEMHKKSQLSPVIVCVLYGYVCGREYALCSIICISFYEVVLKPFNICPPVEGSESNITHALISEQLNEAKSIGNIQIPH